MARRSGRSGGRRGRGRETRAGGRDPLDRFLEAEAEERFWADTERRQAVSRRRVLGTIGAGAAGVAGGVAAAAGLTGGDTTPRLVADVGHRTGRASTRTFGRIFTELPPFAEPGRRVRAALMDMGRPGGLLDANDPLEEGPRRLITEPGLSANNPDNETHTAGTTFFGQFLDHDMTFDADSRLGARARPGSTRNERTPALDLDSVYGRGPFADRQLYRNDDRAKLKVGRTGPFEDLPRQDDGDAIIGDFRNDENLMIAGIHAAFLLFHNRIVDMLRDDKGRGDVFRTARRLVIRHYHWIILHEYLPQIIGRARVERILRRGRRLFDPEGRGAAMPVEFQGAAYRFGHSMVRPSYRANLAGDDGEPFFGFIFDQAEDGRSEPGDLRGGVRSPRRFIDWETFFPFNDELKRNKLIDTKISTPMLRLPLFAIPDQSRPTSVVQRNLLRHLTWSLPSGQAIARRIGAERLTRAELGELREFGSGLQRATPLWYYILKEAEVAAEGRHLGPVGGTIVGECVIALMEADQRSFVGRDPKWRPTLPSRDDGDFAMHDLLTFARVDPESRKEAARRDRGSG